MNQPFRQSAIVVAAFFGAVILSLVPITPAQAFIFHGGGAVSGGGPGTILTTMNIVNVGTAAETAGFDTPSVGINFPSCTDQPMKCVASGQAPQFRDVSTGDLVPYSWTCATDVYASANCSAWPDGSLRNAGFIFQDPENITTAASFTGSQSGTTLTTSSVTGTLAIGQEVFGMANQAMTAETIIGGSGSSWTVSYSQAVASGPMLSGTVQPVYVENGGTPPSVSGRSLSDVYAQAITVHAASVGSGYCSWTGDQYAYVDNPGSDSNNWKQTKFMDGAAGAGWEIWSHFAPTQGGTAQGQLELTSYVYALNDNLGNLGAVRDLNRAHQPWYNPTNTTGVGWCGVNTLEWSQNGNSPQSFIPSTLTATPFTAVNFTATNGNRTFTSSANTLEQGTPTSEGGAPAYAALVTNVSGPTNLPTSQLAWVYALSSTTFNISTAANSQPTSGGNVTPNASGTGTITPIMAILYYGGLFNETSNCKYNFFQPTGYSGPYPSNDNTVIVQFSSDWLRLTGMLPPLGNVTGVNDNTFAPSSSYPGNNNQCFPGAQSLLQTYMESSGPRNDIGPETGWATRDFFNQSPGDDTLMRLLAFAGADEAYDLRDHVTGEPLVSRPPLAGGSYTGLPSPIINSTYQMGATWTGIQSTPTTNGSYGFSSVNTSHQAEVEYYAAQKTGEPQFTDLLYEQSNSEMLYSNSFRNSHGLVSPCGDYDTLLYGGAQFRGVAWNIRDLMLAAAISPAVDPDGSQKPQYYNDLELTNTKFADCEMANGLLGSYSTSTGLFEQGVVGTALDATGAPSFQDAYFDMALAYAAYTNKDSYALDYLTNYAAKWRLHVLNTFGGYDLYPEYGNVVVNGGLSYTGNALISSDADYAIEPPELSSLAWTNSSPGFTLTLLSTSSGYVPVGNDIWLFTGGIPTTGPPGNFSQDTPYCATNVSTVTSLIYTFDLFARPGGGCSAGGSTITPSNAGSMVLQSGPVGPMVQPLSPPAASTGYTPTAIGTGQGGGYSFWALAAERWMAADGITGLGTPSTGLIGDAQIRNTVGGLTNADIAASPTFSMSACFTSATC